MKTLLPVLLLSVLPRFAAADAAFELSVVDTFTISGGVVVVTGVVAEGNVASGDTVCLVRANGARREVTIGGIERFRKILDSASKGDHVGLLLDGLKKGDVDKGDEIAGRC